MSFVSSQSSNNNRWTSLPSAFVTFWGLKPKCPYKKIYLLHDLMHRDYFLFWKCSQFRAGLKFLKPRLHNHDTCAWRFCDISVGQTKSQHTYFQFAAYRMYRESVFLIADQSK